MRGRRVERKEARRRQEDEESCQPFQAFVSSRKQRRSWSIQRHSMSVHVSDDARSFGRRGERRTELRLSIGGNTRFPLPGHRRGKKDKCCQPCPPLCIRPDTPFEDSSVTFHIPQCPIVPFQLLNDPGKKAQRRGKSKTEMSLWDKSRQRTPPEASASSRSHSSGAFHRRSQNEGRNGKGGGSIRKRKRGSYQQDQPGEKQNASPGAQVPRCV